MPDARLIGCPRCGSTEDLGTLESIPGIAYAELLWKTGGVVEPDYQGETKVIWDEQAVDDDTPFFCNDCGEAFRYSDVAAKVLSPEARRAGLIVLGVLRDNAGQQVNVDLLVEILREAWVALADDVELDDIAIGYAVAWIQERGIELKFYGGRGMPDGVSLP